MRIEASEHFNILLLDMHTPAEQRILLEFLRSFKELQHGNYTDISPERLTIAKNSKCSLRTVKRYINCEDNENFKLIMSKECRPNKNNGKNTSNLYKDLNKDFFEFLDKLNDLGWAKNYKKHRKWIKEGIEKQDGFVHDKWMKKHKLSTTKRAEVLPQKRATIKTSSYKDNLKNIRTKTESTAASCTMKTNALLSDLKLERSTHLWLDKNCSYSVALASKQDIDWYGRHRIENIDRFLISRVKDNTRKLFGGKRW